MNDLMVARESSPAVNRTASIVAVSQYRFGRATVSFQFRKHASLVSIILCHPFLQPMLCGAIRLGVTISHRIWDVNYDNPTNAIPSLRLLEFFSRALRRWGILL